ncbi:hypothetical protein AB0O58_13095 [Rhodococcus sp. NPDC080181]
MSAPVIDRPVRPFPKIEGVRFYAKGERFTVDPETSRRERVVFSI